MRAGFCQFVNKQQTVQTWLTTRAMLRGRTWSNICHPLTHLIPSGTFNVYTAVCYPDSSKAFIFRKLVFNWLPLGGVNNCACFTASMPCISNPRSAIIYKVIVVQQVYKMTFLYNFSVWDAAPIGPLTNVIHTFGDIPTRPLRSFHWNRTYTEIFLKLCQLIV